MKLVITTEIAIHFCLFKIANDTVVFVLAHLAIGRPCLKQRTDTGPNHLTKL